MELPDAPIAHEGFFVTHFLTVRDQEKSKDLDRSTRREHKSLDPGTVPTFKLIA
jgi:hypothetical protein